MWKKPDLEPQDVPAQPAKSVSSSAVPEKATRGQAAIIGPSITISGDVTGDEDLVIQGKIDGVIQLKQNNVTVGQQGVVNANISANIITIEGESRGDLHGHEKVIIRKTGNVEGNIEAPRVVLEDGAIFKGSIDMTRKQTASAISSKAEVTTGASNKSTTSNTQAVN